jgi:hypothetical protein
MITGASLQRLEARLEQVESKLEKMLAVLDFSTLKRVEKGH